VKSNLPASATLKKAVSFVESEAKPIVQEIETVVSKI